MKRSIRNDVPVKKLKVSEKCRPTTPDAGTLTSVGTFEGSGVDTLRSVTDSYTFLCVEW